MSDLDSDPEVLYTYDSGIKIGIDETGQTMLMW